MGGGSSVVNGIMGIKRLNFAREQFESQKPLLQARQKLLNSQAKMSDAKLKFFEEFSNKFSPGVEQANNAVDRKISEMMASGVGQMGQLTGQGGMGVVDMMSQIPQELMQPQGVQAQQGQRQGGGLNITPELVARAGIANIGGVSEAFNAQHKMRVFNQSQENIDYDNALAAMKYNRQGTLGSYQESWNPQTQTMDKIWVPKFGKRPPVLKGKSPEFKTPINSRDNPLWFHGETGEHPPEGMTPEEARDAGFKRVQTTQTEKLRKIQAVQDIIEEVESMMTDVVPKDDKSGRLGGLVRAGRSIAQMEPGGQKLAVMRDYIDGNKAQVAKALGEVGNLSESEQEAVIKLFGGLTDSGPKAWMQFELLKKTFNKAKTSALGIAAPKEDPLGIR